MDDRALCSDTVRLVTEPRNSLLPAGADPASPVENASPPLGAVRHPDDAAALSEEETHALAETLAELADTLDSSEVGTRHPVSDELRVLLVGSFDIDAPEESSRIALVLEESGDELYAQRMREELYTFILHRSMGLPEWGALTGLEYFDDEDQLYTWLLRVYEANFSA